MSIINLPNGFGGTAGSGIALQKPLQVSGNVWYVDSVTGTDAVSPAGKDRSKPLATLSRAQTNGADGDIVVFLPTHTETLTGTLTLSKNLILVGEGSSSGNPTVKFFNDHASSVMWAITATGAFQMHNLYFGQAVRAASAAKITDATTANLTIRDCYFDQGANDVAEAINISGTDVDIRSTSFVSAGTSNTAQPHSAIEATGTLVNVTLSGVVIDGGAYGWANTYAVDFAAGTSVTNLFNDNMSLLNSSLMQVFEATDGYINIATSTGGARVDWCDVT